MSCALIMHVVLALTPEAERLAGEGMRLVKASELLRAADSFERALAIEQRTAQPDVKAIISLLQATAQSYEGLGRYADVERIARAIIDLGSRGRAPAVQADGHFRAGKAQLGVGRYAEAEQSLLRAQQLAPKDDARFATFIEGTLATLYSRSGREDKALAGYERIVIAFEKAGAKRDLVSAYMSQATLLFRLERTDAAVGLLEKAIALDATLPASGTRAQLHSGLGVFLMAKGALQRAFDELTLAVTISKQQHDPRSALDALSNLPELLMMLGKLDDAVAVAKTHVALRAQLGQELDALWGRLVLGRALLKKRDVAAALEVNAKVVDDIERQLTRVAGSDRRSFLSSMSSALQALTHVQVLRGDSAATFAAMERGRSRQLSERLGAQPSAVSLAEVQAGLGPGEAVLSVTPDIKDGKICALLVTAKNAVTKELELGLEVAQQSTSAPRPQASRGIKPAAGARRPVDATASRIIASIEELRRVLTTSGGAEEQARLLTAAHGALLGPLPLDGVQKLLIVADDELALLPFEALRDRAGRYVAETTEVRYAHSIAVARALEARRHGDDRLPILAFANPVFPRGAAAVAGNVGAQIEGHSGSFAPFYATLGIDAWDSLPGTEKEVEAIARLRPGAKTIAGAGASEEAVKSLSRSGELARYRVLHFATHGLVVPEQPQLAALVLGASVAEDGYLRAPEISKLKLAADLVTLSACETGMGRVYGGEGVVGLSQAFLEAGANGLQVSLWRVSDAATQTLMTAFYERANGSYATALADTKRAAIRGELGPELRSAEHWASFVYYGRR